jgi:hypothetical protein
MNKFEHNLNLSNKEIRENRATLITEEVKDAMAEAVRIAKKTQRDLEVKLLGLTDLHPNSKLSLRVMKEEFVAIHWVNELNTLKLQILNATVAVKIAEESEKEWFLTEVAAKDESISEQK